MHELSVTQGILDTVLKHADEAQAKRVIRINLVIGELSDLNHEWMQRYFDYQSKGTIAEGARLQVRRNPAGFTCHDCDTEFDLDLKSIESVSCPECKGTNCTLERGREFFIDDMEVEE